MYCGSCLRDNALAAELLARGHDVLLTPVYTPTRTDERNVSGGTCSSAASASILEQHAPLFRHTPRLLDRLWDSDVGAAAGDEAADQGRPEEPRRADGLDAARRATASSGRKSSKLLDWLSSEPRFDIVNLPYALLLGLAEPLQARAEGADLLHAAGRGSVSRRPWRTVPTAVARSDSRRSRSRRRVSAGQPRTTAISCRDTSACPRSKMRVAPLGINLEGYAPRQRRAASVRSRSDSSRGSRPRKGCTCCATPISDFARSRRGTPARLVVAGYLAPEHQRISTRSSSRCAMPVWPPNSNIAASSIARQDCLSAEPRRDVRAGDLRRAERHLPSRGDGQRRSGRAAAPRRVPGNSREDRRRPLVDADDPDALPRRSDRLQNDPRARAPRSVEAGAAGVRAHYSVGQMAETVEQHLRRRRSTAAAPRPCSRSQFKANSRHAHREDIAKSYPTPRGRCRF